MAEQAQLKAFEAALDGALERRPLIRADPWRALQDAAGAISVARAAAYDDPHAHAAADAMTRGLNVALPFLIREGRGSLIEMGSLLDDLQFMSHYFMLREYLYYSYNAPGSFAWTFANDRVEVSFMDPSVPRQFSQYANTALLVSGDIADDLGEDHHERHLAALNGAEEFGSQPHIESTLRELLREVDARIPREFSLLYGHGHPVQLRNYAYSDFYAVHRYLLAKALYHRYYARANRQHATFEFPKELLQQEIAGATELATPVVRAVLEDVCYSPRNRALPPMYFNLYDHPRSLSYIMLPHNYARSEGFVHHLRVVAARDPAWFSAHLSGPLGGQFVEKVAQSFRDAGFLARTNVSLDELDASAPDIDVFVVSPEPTLGYVIWLCEVKATLPAVWAKDHLRLLHPDVMPKALSQVTRLMRLLEAEEGARFLWHTIRQLAPSGLEEGVVAVRGMIVTTHSTGMFLSEGGRTVIDHPTLSQILRRCDGDVVYLDHMLRDLPTLFGTTEEVRAIEVDVSGLRVSYPVVTSSRLLQFSPNEWKSIGLDVEMADEFYRDGGSPFDVLGDLPEGESDPPTTP